MDDLDRRVFLKRVVQASLGVGGLGAGVLACRDRGGRDATDGGTRDAGDGGELDATAADVRSAPRELTKPPFTQVEGPKSVVLRFETRKPEPIEVRLEGEGAGGVEKETSTSTREVDFAWPPKHVRPLDVERPDNPGTYTVHEARFEGLSRGDVRNWVVHLGDGAEISGRVRVPPPSGAPFRFQFVSDTMHPNSQEVASMLESSDPDLVLHGGDIQYQSNPFDTFNGLFYALSGLMTNGAMHFAIGNHEREGRGEFDLFWKRLFAHENGDGNPRRYHSFTFGGVHCVFLNSESEFEKGTAQFQWMKSELESAQMRPEVRYSVVVFHRPFFTFSRSAPDLATRDVFHPIFRDNGVRLVLTGHNHCYERFRADGVTYVVDGGGGAARYAPDATREEVLDQRPADEMRRKASHGDHGALTFDVESDGTIRAERRTDEGDRVDQFRIG